MYKNGSCKILKQGKLRSFGRSSFFFLLRFKNRWRVDVQKNTGKASSWQNQSKADSFAETVMEVLLEGADEVRGWIYRES